MGFLDLNLTLDVSKIDLFLAKPDKTIIANLNEAFNKSHSIKLGGINELSFSIPYDLDVSHHLLRNPNVDLIKDRYLIKTLISGIEEWYIINKTTDVFDDNGDSKQVACMLLPYEMSSKTLHILSRDGVNLTNALTGGYTTDQNGNVNQYDGILNNTRWSLGYVDSRFDISFRSISFSSVTILDAILQVAQTFQSVIVWDTLNRKINFYLPENIGTNKGLTLSYSRYLKTLSREVNSDEMVTRLKVFGANDMSINDVNPTGQNYIEDLSFFMYPFQRDISRNVLLHSDYMTDSLCHSILDYQVLIDSSKDQFNGYYNSQAYYNLIMSEKTYEKDALTVELAVIDSRIVTANSISADTSTLVANKTAKTAEINTKIAEIVITQASLDALTIQVATLRNSIDGTKYFSTRGLIEELNDYIIEKEWTDSNYTNPSDLYNDAIIKFQSMKVPQVVLSIGMINFLEIIEAQRDWNKLNLGDTITIFYEKMNINIESKIIEINTNTESGDITLTIANTKDILTDEQKLIKLLYNSATTSANLETGKNKWDSVVAVNSKVEQLINNIWDANKLAVTGGLNNSVTFDEHGLLIRNSTDPLNYLVANNAILAITNDGGNTWKNAITKNGIVGERVYGKVLAGVQLIIDASNSLGTRTLLVDSTGVTITGGSLTITGGLPDAQVASAIAWNNAATTAANSVQIATSYDNVIIRSSATGTQDKGISVIDSLVKSKTVLNSVGLRMYKNTGTTGIPVWLNVFSADTNGDLSITGAINATSGTFSGSITASGTITGGAFVGGNISNGTIVGSSINIGSGVFTVNTAGVMSATGANISGNITMTGGTISWGSITAPSYSQVTGTKPATNADNTNGALLGNGFTTIGSNYIYTGTLSAGQVNAVAINASSITVGTLSAARISTVGLSAEKIYQAGSPNNYGVIGGIYGDLTLYYANTVSFGFYNDNQVVSFRYKNNAYMYTNGITTYAQGTWDFSLASVTGMTAKFG